VKYVRINTKATAEITRIMSDQILHLTYDFLLQGAKFRTGCEARSYHSKLKRS
jgi:hypothetical protein